MVRGAPAIAIVGCLSIAAELAKESSIFNDCTSLHTFVCDSLAHLITARPTAVNMKAEALRLTEYSCSLLTTSQSVTEMMNSILAWCENLLKMDLATNKTLGDWGMQKILQLSKKDGEDGFSLITICNTGSLATAGYGTALGVVRSLHAIKKLKGLYMLETRPYMQGSRLSAYEAVVEGWPNATLICDGAVGALLSSSQVDAAVVGADCVAANGDTANKIGTYQLAVLCAAHHVKFFVCAPTSSINLKLSSGAGIPIEHRPALEMTSVAGVPVAAPGIACWNPAFDVTPARLITGIITEYGVFTPEKLEEEISSRI
ncbi:hypothetical protein HAZT_HAZT007830 [Hyalella azteca]|uniref:S-methyl-5-thioribose-1-phosphate isomerase n=1 Tax=Hyalella azteca TaxID=294128 RepID=A0A6A0H918_HYAAZ|nr:hypothetical protein HAZT_HAZT007830 [Hyalella azteca]